MENEDLSSPAPAPVAAVPAVAPVAAPAPVPAVPQFDPRRRIRELQSIPERDRTDAEWDELNELEIQTAPGNRAGNQQPMGAPYGGAKPGGSFHQKNRMKGKGGGKPGGGGRPPQGGNKPHNNNPNKPRPA